MACRRNRPRRIGEALPWTIASRRSTACSAAMGLKSRTISWTRSFKCRPWVRHEGSAVISGGSEGYSCRCNPVHAS